MRQLRFLVAAVGVIAIPAVPAHAVWGTNGVVVCNSTATQDEPAVAGDGAGGAYVVFTNGGGATLPALIVRHFTRAGVAYLAQAACGDSIAAFDGEFSSASVGSPRIAADGRLGAVVAWVGSRDGSLGENIYAQRVSPSGGGVWGRQGVVVCGAQGDQSFAIQSYRATCPDGNGGCYVTWQDPRSGASGLDIYLQHLDPFGQVVPGWPGNGLAICTAPGVQRQASVIPDGTGGALVVWEDGRNGSDFDIYAIRIASAATIVSGWPSNGVSVCGQGGDQLRPAPAEDGAGGLLVTWQDGRSATSFDIYLAHVLPNGNPDVSGGWLADGVAVCTEGTSQENPDIASDLAGGAIVAWMDRRSVPLPGLGAADIYAQRVSSTGMLAAGWAANGNPLCIAERDQAFPRMVSDGLGGAIVAWDDKRSNTVGEVDIYAQRVKSDGTLQSGWTTDGVPLCTAANTQDIPVIAAGDPGSAIVAWRDMRSDIDHPDVYAQRVDAAGGAGGTVGVPTTGSMDHSIVGHPNPASKFVEFEIASRMGSAAVLTVRDLAGRRVRQLPVERGSDPRTGTARWDLRDDHGVKVRPGIYWAAIGSAGARHQRAIVVTR